MLKITSASLCLAFIATTANADQLPMRNEAVIENAVRCFSTIRAEMETSPEATISLAPYAFAYAEQARMAGITRADKPTMIPIAAQAAGAVSSDPAGHAQDLAICLDAVAEAE